MLYLVTNRNLITKGTLISVLGEAIEGGVDIIILREKDLPFEELLKLAKEIKTLIRGRGTQLYINGNLEIAQLINAEGYHCSYNTFINTPIDFNGIIGVSVHSIEEAIFAEQRGADYLFAGHIFPTDCKKFLEPRGIKWLESLIKQVNIPVVPIGGISPNNIASLPNLKSIAVMSQIMAAGNPKEVVRELKGLLNNYTSP
jgi:thiamine-phosphate diphosphorylase